MPPYLKRTKRIEEFIPWLYLKGISTGDIGSTLSVLLGEEVRGLSPNVVSTLKQQWEAEYEAWNKLDLSHKRYVYVWADGVYSNVRMDDRLWLLVLVGSDEHGRKELLALCDGFRESEASWSETLQSLKNRGLKHPPHVAIGDGSLGFWKAVNKIWPETTNQRCWVHKTANVLDKLPKSMQPKVKEALYDIFQASTRADAYKSFEHCMKIYQAKYPKAMECLEKDKEALLAFYDYPAEHWIHLRTTNPIESVFATVRLRTDKTKKTAAAEQQRWRWDLS